VKKRRTTCAHGDLPLALKVLELALKYGAGAEVREVAVKY
jgi:hypothetical protein